jgi:hypothetical protein
MTDSDFKQESEMLPSAQRWLVRRGFATKSEFVNSWGVCDLVGCSFKQDQVRQRMAYGQRQPIGPPLRISLLLHIPDHQSRKSIGLARLAESFSGIVSEDRVNREVQQLVARRFVRLTSKGNLQKLNGWMPLHDKLVTIELKLNRVQEAIEQASANRWLSPNAYVGLPYGTAKSILKSPKRRSFEALGLGLLAVARRSCKELIAPQVRIPNPDPVAVAHCVERFWRSHLKAT